LADNVRIRPKNKNDKEQGSKRYALLLAAATGRAVADSQSAKEQGAVAVARLSSFDNREVGFVSYWVEVEISDISVTS
jgi:hypothetical protein